jgi:hydrogenase maturation factor HypE
VARAKSGTRMSHVSVISKEVDSSWVTDHYNGLLTTVFIDVLSLETEDSLIMTTEDAVTLQTNEPQQDIEITSIGFVADETESSNSTAGQFQS